MVTDWQTDAVIKRISGTFPSLYCTIQFINVHLLLTLTHISFSSSFSSAYINHSSATEVGNSSETDVAEAKSNTDAVAEIVAAVAVPQSTINPLTNRQYTPHFDLLQQRKKLPIWEQRRQFMRLFMDNRVVVLVGETGSRKTTQIPQFLVDSGFATPAKMIGIT